MSRHFMETSIETTTAKLLEAPVFHYSISRHAGVYLEKYIQFIENESLPEN